MCLPAGGDSEYSLECVIPEEICMETFTSHILGFPSSAEQSGSSSPPQWWKQSTAVLFIFYAETEMLEYVTVYIQNSKCDEKISILSFVAYCIWMQ